MVVAQTDSLRRDQVAEEGGEEDEDEGVGDPGDVLQGHVPPQLPVNPLIGWSTNSADRRLKEQRAAGRTPVTRPYRGDSWHWRSPWSS